MSDAVAWAALGLSVANTGWLVGRATVGKRRRTAIGPASEIRDVVSAARSRLQHLVIAGGETTDWFSHPERRIIGQQLTDLAMRVHDATLRREMLRLDEQWRTCRGKSPPSREPRAYLLGPGIDDDPSYAAEEAELDRRRGDVAESAMVGVEIANAALDRLNHLETRLP